MCQFSGGLEDDCLGPGRSRQEASGTSRPLVANGPTEVSKWILATTWFIRACALIVLVVSLPRIMHEGWPHDLRSCGGVMGIVQATMLFVMSFLYATTGRTKVVIAAVTIVLALWVIVFSAASLILPHP